MSPENGYELLVKAMMMIPLSHYLWGILLVLGVFWYNILECFLVEEFLGGLRGSEVKLVYNSCSEIYHSVVSKCRVLQGRYLATPWLSSPHLLTAFLHFFGRPPAFSYRRQVFHAPDGGTIALDWLMSSDVCEDSICRNNSSTEDDTIPIVAVVPGLANDSTSAYLKHLVFNVAKHGWNAVVINHRGLGGISVTSDCFYNAGWTEDVREVIGYLHRKYPNVPLFAVGTSIGANILVKYLGEEKESTAIAGAAAVCSPWDLLIGERFISRKLIQKVYDRAIAFGLQAYAQLHQARFTRLANWEGIKKSRSIRDFDNHATCLVGKFETADTYYRRCSSTSYVEHVSVPLLCVSSLDDPVCTREAIPWDECRANKNIVLAASKHGGHLAFFEGITASRIWWVRAVLEFLIILHSSSYMHVQKKTENQEPHSSFESSIDHQGPFINLSDGMVAAIGNEGIEHLSESQNCSDKADEVSSDSDQDEEIKDELKTPIKKCLNKLSRQNRTSMWLLALVAISSSWPLVGTALRYIFKKKLRIEFPAKISRF